MAHRHRQTPRHRSLPPQRRRRAQTRRARPRTRSPRTNLARPRLHSRQHHQRRPPPPRLHRLPSHPPHRVPRPPHPPLLGGLTATAKRRAIDLFRRNAVAERKHEELARELEALEQTSPDLDSTLDNPISDDLLRLVFIACHPILPTESRAALTLRLLGGLTTDEIARAFLTPEPTIPQRIGPANRTP